MSFASLQAETEAISAKIRNIINRIRTATLEELHAVEEHFGLAHPETNTFHDFDNRLGTLVNHLHEAEPAQLDTAADILGVGADSAPTSEEAPTPAAPANVIPMNAGTESNQPPVNASSAPADQAVS